MNIGALATIAVMNPPNLAVVCIDNGHYGETGYQKNHTSLGVDLEKITAGSGIRRTCTIASEDELADSARMLREGTGPAFVLLRLRLTDPPVFKRATWIRLPAAAAFGRRCSAPAKRGRAPLSRARLPPHALRGRPRPAPDAAIRTSAAATRRPRPYRPLATGSRRDCP